MKICYLVTSLESGGAEAAIPRIVRVIQERGHAVRVVACEPRDRGNEAGLVQAGIPYRLLFNRWRNPFPLLRALDRDLRRDPVDLIWTSLSTATFVGSLLGAWRRIPVVSWKHSASIRPHVYWTRKLSAFWITDSASVTRYLIARGGVPAAKVQEWPIYEALQLHAWPQPWHAGEKLHIGSVGRLHPVKNYGLLIDAIARLRQQRPDLAARIQVTIVGEGPARQALERQIARLGLGAVIGLPGALADVRPFLASLHVYVQPSRYEGMCLAAHEAMTAGLPVIATPVGEVRESLEKSEGGVLLDPADVVGSLARALTAAIEHPETLAPLGQRARAYIDATYSRAAFAAAGERVVRRAEEVVRNYRR